jgi:predicted metalloprotease with PDZ domain
MRKLLLTIPIVLLLAVAAWFGWKQLPRDPAAWDGQPNRYQVRIDPDGSRAQVEAELFVAGDLLSMFSVMPLPELPNGQVDLVEDLVVTDLAGKRLSLRNQGWGDFRLDGRQRLKLSYSVRLEHDRHPWPPGTEEVGYRTSEGVMLTGASLFFADGGEKMFGPIEVSFELPPGWRAITPWERVGEGERFAVPERRELLSNAIFLGTIATEVVEIGGVHLTLALGERYLASRDLFVELLRTQLESYVALFDGPPRAGRYLIVINENQSGDGGAFLGSFSQFIAGDADERNRVIWGYVMAHELLHFWNGLSFMPADTREEWFKEGATDYLTIATLARNGLIDESLLFKRLENVPRRYLMARMLQRLGMSVRDAGKDKQPNRLLVYGGGSLAAMALDVELRVRSDDRVGLPQLLQALQREVGRGDTRDTQDDNERIERELTGHDFAPVVDQAVERGDYFDIRPTLANLGLRMDSFVEEMFIGREPNATPAQRARFDAIFAPLPVANGSVSEPGLSAADPG